MRTHKVVQGKNTEQQIATLNCPNFEFLFLLFVFVCLFVFLGELMMEHFRCISE